MQEPLELPIYKISHLTHNKPATAIAECVPGPYIFKPHMKFDKKYVWGIEALGESFRPKDLDAEPTHDAVYYEKVSSDTPIIPGLIPWWCH